MMARSSKAPSIGRIQKRKTNLLQIIIFGLQRAAGPYRWVKGAHAAADDDKSRKGLHSFLKSLRNARNNYSNGS